MDEDTTRDDLRAMAGAIVGMAARDVRGMVLIVLPDDEGRAPVMTSDAPRPWDLLNGLAYCLLAILQRAQAGDGQSWLAIDTEPPP